MRKFLFPAFAYLLGFDEFSYSKIGTMTALSSLHAVDHCCTYYYNSNMARQDCKVQIRLSKTS
jgi:hypothetical protein